MGRKKQRFQPEPEDDEESRADRRAEDRALADTLAELADDLAALNAPQRGTLALPDMLDGAILELGRVKKGARVRQRRFVVKQLRSQDIEALRRAVDLFDATSEASHTRAQLVERLREGLLAVEGANEALEHFLQTYPAAERQPLRQLVRAARRDVSGVKRKALYRYIRDCL